MKDQKKFELTDTKWWKKEKGWTFWDKCLSTSWYFFKETLFEKVPSVGCKMAPARIDFTIFGPFFAPFGIESELAKHCYFLKNYQKFWEKSFFQKKKKKRKYNI